jgi:hypothetical protein
MALALVAAAAVYFAIWSSPLSSYQIRFLVPLWLILAPMIAAGMEASLGVVRSRRWPRLTFTVVLAAVLLANLPPWIPLHEGDREGSPGWLTHVVREPPIAAVLGGVSRDEYLREQLRSYGAWQWIHANTPPSAKILTLFGGDHLYSNRARLWSESVTAHPLTWAAVDGSGADLRAQLKRLSITHVLVPSDTLMEDEYRRLDLLQPATVARLFQPIYSDRWTVVYRVREFDKGSDESAKRYGM